MKKVQVESAPQCLTAFMQCVFTLHQHLPLKQKLSVKGDQKISVSKFT